MIILINWLKKNCPENLTINSHELIRAGSRTIVLNHTAAEMLGNCLGQLADRESTE